MTHPTAPCPILQTCSLASSSTPTPTPAPPDRAWQIGERVFWRYDGRHWERAVVICVLPPTAGRPAGEIDAVERLRIALVEGFARGSEWQVPSSAVRREEELVLVLRSEVAAQVLWAEAAPTQQRLPESAPSPSPSQDLLGGLSPEACHAQWRVNAAALDRGDVVPHPLTPAQVAEAKLHDAGRQQRQVELLRRMIARSAERARNQVRVDLEFDPWE